MALEHTRNFGNNNNRVSSTVAGAWTDFGDAPWRGVFDFQGVYWDGSATKDLKIRDVYEDEIYHAVSDGTAVIDLLASPITVKGPLQYYTDEAAKKIVIYGKIE